MQADDARIVDIVLAAAEISDLVRGMSYEEYQLNGVVRAAVQWHVYVIGEATRQLSGKFKTQHSTVPWHQIIGARNILAHEYGRIDHEIMWQIATRSVPELSGYLQPLAPPEVEE